MIGLEKVAFLCQMNFLELFFNIFFEFQLHKHLPNFVLFSCGTKQNTEKISIRQFRTKHIVL